MAPISFREASADPDKIFLGRGGDHASTNLPAFKGWAFNSAEDHDQTTPGDYFGADPEMFYFISRDDLYVNEYLKAFGQAPMAPERHIEVEPGALDHIPLKDIVRFMHTHDLYLDTRDSFTIRRNK